MTTAAEKKLFDKIDDINKQLGKLRTDVEVLKVRSGSLTMKNMFLGLGAIGTFLAGMGLNLG